MWGPPDFLKDTLLIVLKMMRMVKRALHEDQGRISNGSSLLREFTRLPQTGP